MTDFFNSTSSINNETERLQDKLSKDILGIIWITSNPIADRLKYFHALDYFVDGLLTEFYKQCHQGKNTSKSNYKKNFFLSRSFDEPFFIGHILSDESEESASIQEDLDELMKLTVPLKTDKNKLLVIDDTKNQKINFNNLSRQKSRFTLIAFKDMAV